MDKFEIPEDLKTRVEDISSLWEEFTWVSGAIENINNAVASPGIDSELRIKLEDDVILYSPGIRNKMVLQSLKSGLMVFQTGMADRIQSLLDNKEG